MKIIVVGGAGTIGKAIVKELASRHEIIIAGRTHGDVKVDMKDLQLIERMYQSVGKFDAVIATAGNVHFADFSAMTTDNYYIGLDDKLMGQVNLVLIGSRYINDQGSFTLTSGILSDDPIRSGSSASMVNGALNSFVIGAAIELPRGVRINVVSPTIVKESVAAYGEFFPGFEPVTTARVATAYIKSVEGAQTGQVYKVWG